MTLTVFGASGRIGTLLVNRALAEGYTVNTYVRNPSKLELKHQHLKIFKGELDDFETIKSAISGVDCVICTLGPPLKRKYEGWAILDGYQNIIRAMESEHVKRFITIATPSVRFKKDVSSMITNLPPVMAKLFFPKAYREIVQIGDNVFFSKLDWTIVRFLAPNDKPSTGNVKITFGDNKIKWGISRSDIADFLLTQTKETQYIHSMPIIGS
jgi:putative NADH-flavin reductase